MVIPQATADGAVAPLTPDLRLRALALLAAVQPCLACTAGAEKRAEFSSARIYGKSPG